MIAQTRNFELTELHCLSSHDKWENVSRNKHGNDLRNISLILALRLSPDSIQMQLTSMYKEKYVVLIHRLFSYLPLKV